MMSSFRVLKNRHQQALQGVQSPFSRRFLTAVEHYNNCNFVHDQVNHRLSTTSLPKDDFLEYRFKNKIALVTGGARGIGESIVRGLVREGAKVLIGDRLTTEGNKLVKDLGPAATFVHLDVRKREEWESALKVCSESFGEGLDLLVNNAGVLGMGSIQRGDGDQFQNILKVNLKGAFYGMSAAFNPLKLNKGNIVNISSIAGLQGYSGFPAYVSSKWALRGLTKAAALEMARHGIRVNGIYPGPIDTPMIQGIAVDNLLKVQPINRLGRPEEVAAAVLFLASRDASFITGAELAVDGGAVLGPLEPLA